jgi:hypothetical protein
MEGALASCKAAALSGLAAAERVEKAAAGSSLLSLMGDLRRVYKFRDARQVCGGVRARLRKHACTTHVSMRMHTRCPDGPVRLGCPL